MTPHPPSPLLNPYTSSALALPNRLVMAPMTRGRADDATGLPSPLTKLYYQQRSSAGLIVSEGIWPHRLTKGAPGSPGLETPEQVAVWQEVTTFVHAAGGRIFAQLWDVGRVSHPVTLGGEQPAAPSAVRAAGQVYTKKGWLDHVTPRALTQADIDARVAYFAQAALHALQAGFDGVEIHAANGYLPHQFLADNTNLRTDRYGGAPENRGRFLLEVVEAVAQAVGAERVGVRLSPGNPEGNLVERAPERVYPQLLAELYRREIAYVHVAEAPAYPAVQAVRAWWPGVLIGNVNRDRPLTPEEGEALIVQGGLELVSFGRLFITNPDLPLRIAAGHAVRQPVARHFYGPDADGYTDYPAMGQDGKHDHAGRRTR